MIELDKELLLLDTASLLESETFRAWALRTELPTPTGYPEVAAARAILLGVRKEEINLPSPAVKESDFAALMARTAGEPATSPQPLRATARRRWLVYVTAAAAVLLLVVASWLNQPQADLYYATGNGELKSVTLPDGTQVTLNANSSLSLAGADWEGRERSVVLDGEAYFDVTKQAGEAGARPFVVQTKGLEVRVLGTRFDVRERRGESRVFLEEGKVHVNWKQEDLPRTELAPGEVVSRKSAGERPVHRPVSVPAPYLAWRNGHLVFNQLSLEDALSELGDIYGIEFRCPDPALKQKEINSAGVPVDDLPLAIQLVEKALSLRVEPLEVNVYQVSAAD